MAWCGQPYRFYCDNGTEFKGDIDELLTRRSPPIETIRGRAYHPQTQSSIEKANGVFKLRLAALCQKKHLPRTWVPLLLELQEVINTTPSRMLPRHITPFELWFGRQPHWIVSPDWPIGE
jgi:hypothetical protein